MKFLLLETSLIDRPHLKEARDNFISYEQDSQWNNPYHVPISWHGFAAAMNGRFVCAPDEKMKESIDWADLILVTFNYNPSASQKIIKKLKEMGKIVIGAFHENGDIFQYNAKNLQWLIDFKNCANECDAILTYPRNTVFEHIYKGMGITTFLTHIPQPYCLEEAAQFIIPENNRAGIFIGPQNKDIELERRNWIYNVIMAIQAIKAHDYTNIKIKPRITTINSTTKVDDATMIEKLKQLSDGQIEFNVIKSLPYKEYLRIIASHQFTINMDSSDTQGQVTADSLFVGVPILHPPIPYYRTDYEDLLFERQDLRYDQFMEDLCSFEHCKEEFTKLYSTLKMLK